MIFIGSGQQWFAGRKNGLTGRKWPAGRTFLISAIVEYKVAKNKLDRARVQNAKPKGCQNTVRK